MYFSSFQVVLYYIDIHVINKICKYKMRLRIPVIIWTIHLAF